MPTPRKTPAPATTAPTDSVAPAAKKAPAKRKTATATGVEPVAARRKRTTTSKVATAAKEPARRKPLVPDGSGNYDLLIVESPAKAKTINKYLGNRFRVLASYGHVRDLATGRKQPGEEISGIRIGDGWKLRYLVDAGAKAGKKKGPPDAAGDSRRTRRRRRQGQPRHPGQRPGPGGRVDRLARRRRTEPGPRTTTLRVRFNEITKNAVQQALAGAASIDMDRVKAQEARRAMDRVVGFPLSALLGDKVTRGLVGRPRAVGRGQADRGPRARDRGVPHRGVLAADRPLGPGRGGRGVHREPGQK